MAESKQLLHFVFGGELKKTDAIEFQDLRKLDFVGMYPNFEEARRAWAAKAQALLGVKAVIALSFERIHRSNLIGMGIYPLEFPAGFDYGALRLRGDEELDFEGLEHISVGLNRVTLRIRDAQGRSTELGLSLRVDSGQEILYLCHGGVLPYVVRKMADAGGAGGRAVKGSAR